MGKLKVWWSGTAPTAKWVFGALLVLLVLGAVVEVVTRLNESGPSRPVSVKAARGSACFSLGAADYAQRYAFDAADSYLSLPDGSDAWRRGMGEANSAREFSDSQSAIANESWGTLKEMAKEKGVSLGNTSDRQQWCQQNELQAYNDGLGK